MSHDIMNRNQHNFKVEFPSLPFISFNLVKRRSKLSTSASPAVRLASSCMSKSVIASAGIHTIFSSCTTCLNIAAAGIKFRENDFRYRSWQKMVTYPLLNPPFCQILYYFLRMHHQGVCPLLANWRTDKQPGLTNRSPQKHSFWNG